MSAPEERRLTPTERLYELSMAWAQRPLAAPEHSIDVTRNAKGDYQFNVTVRGHDLEAMEADVIAIVGRLEVRYPRGNGATP